NPWEGKEKAFLKPTILDDSMTAPQKVDAAILPFQTIFFITAFCSTCIITDGLSGIIFFKGSLLYTSYSVLQRRKVKL
uniref:Uncharacterized protein n=1 Tax=Moschus moschiferus TaxID=68415 RepID=A0A8C6FES7_MOSMO